MSGIQFSLELSDYWDFSLVFVVNKTNAVFSDLEAVHQPQPRGFAHAYRSESRGVEITMRTRLYCSVLLL